MVDLDPVTPPVASWPVFVNTGASVGSPGTMYADTGTGRGLAAIDLVGPDPSDPTALDKVGPPDGVPDLLQASSNSPGLPLSAGPGQWVDAPVGTLPSTCQLFRTEANGDRTDVTAFVSPFDLDGYSMAYPGGSPWGVVCADFDDDGDQDVFFPCGGFNLNARNSLMRNEGDGTFRNVSQLAGFTLEQATFGASWFDYDRDGDLDLFETNAGTNWTNYQGEPDAVPDDRLFQNSGTGTFAEVGALAGVDLRSDGFACIASDLDRDGWPDLVVSCFRQLNKLFYNNGDGTFAFMAPDQNEDVALTLAGAMIPDPNSPGTEELAFIPPGFGDLLPIRPKRSMPIAVEDFNADGWPDVFFSSWSRQLADDNPNSALGALFDPWDTAGLYLNLGDQDGDGLGDGLFREVAAEVGIEHVGGSMGLLASDLNGDGAIDLYLGAGGPILAIHEEEDYLYINEGSAWPRDFQKNPDQPLDRAFYEIGALAGSYANLNMAHGILGSLRGTGVVDVAVGNGGPAWSDSGQPNYFWENQGNASGVEPHYLQVELDTPNVAVGARIEVISVSQGALGHRLARERAAGQAFASHDGAPLLFGLGAKEPVFIRALWPNGTVSGRAVWLEQQGNQPITLAEPALSFGLDLDYPQSGGVRIQVHFDNTSNATLLRQLWYVYGQPIAGGIVPVLAVPLGNPLPLASGIVLDMSSAVLPALPVGLHALMALDPVTGAIREASADWHSAELLTATSGGGRPTASSEPPRPKWHDALRASPEQPSDPVGSLALASQVEISAHELLVAPAQLPLEWSAHSLSETGTLALVAGAKVRWKDGHAFVEVQGSGTASLSFHGGEVSLSVGGAEGCCDMRNTETGVLVRFGELQDSIVVDGVEYSLQGERISP